MKNTTASPLVKAKKTPNKKNGGPKSPKNTPASNKKKQIPPPRPKIEISEEEEDSESSDLEVPSPTPVVATPGTKRKAAEKLSEPVQKQPKGEQNAQRRIAKEDNAGKDPETLARTLFVGNLPASVDSKKLTTVFGKYGKIESVRIKGKPDPELVKNKAKAAKKSVFAFIVYEDKDDAETATEVNGTLFEQHHLRAHVCSEKEKPPTNQSIFVGNLSFTAEEDALWKLFESCGTISSVRIIRNKKTGTGKGFGYVNFEDADAVAAALEMENVVLNERVLRISECKENAPKKAKQAKSPAKKNASPIKKNIKKGLQGKLAQKKSNGVNKGAAGKAKKGKAA